MSAKLKKGCFARTVATDGDLLRANFQLEFKLYPYTRKVFIPEKHSRVYHKGEVTKMMHKVEIQEIDGLKDITIEYSKPKRALRNALMTFGFHYDSQRQVFRTPLYKNAVMRLQDVKNIIPLIWGNDEVQAFADCL